MSDWTPSQTCPGYREKTIQRGNATIISRRPVLDETERAKREKHVQNVLGCVLRDHYKRKEQTHHES
jgi:hypothetical protein